MIDYNSSIMERLSQLLETGSYSDVEFVFENGEKVKGHKLIFAISSPVFSAMLYGGMAEKSDVKINGIEPKAFKTMTEYIYKENIKLDSVSDAISVYEAGHKYDLQHLEKLSEEYIKLNLKVIDTVEVLQFIHFHEISDIKESCMKFLREDTECVLQSEKFIDCDLNILEKIVNENDLKINEINLFEYIEKWAKQKAEDDDVPLSSIRPLLNTVIGKIRFLSMTPSEFITSPYRSELITAEEKHCIFMNLSEFGSYPLLDSLSDCRKSRSVLSKFSGGDSSFSSESSSFHLTPTELSIKWRTKVSDMEPCGWCYSPSFCIDDSALQIAVFQKINGHFNIHLKCVTLKCKRPCKIEMSLKILRKSSAPFVTSGLMYFCSEEVSLSLISKSTLLDESYICNDSLLIELDLKTVLKEH